MDVERSLELGTGNVLEGLGIVRLEELSDLSCNPVLDVVVSVRDTVDGEFAVDDDINATTWADV